MEFELVSIFTFDAIAVLHLSIWFYSVWLTCSFKLIPISYLLWTHYCYFEYVRSSPDVCLHIYIYIYIAIYMFFQFPDLQVILMYIYMYICRFVSLFVFSLSIYSHHSVHNLLYVCCYIYLCTCLIYIYMYIYIYIYNY